MSIEEICRKYSITNYTINDDGSIDVDGNVFINGFDMYELPLKFNNVTGGFNCNDNNLTTLKGCPKSVGDFFLCSENNLTNLKYSPKSVVVFQCDYNKLTSLKEGPELVRDSYHCDENNLTDLKGSPEYISRHFK